MSDSPYQPVACALYDELGLRMMRGTPCRLVVEGSDGRDVLETTIADLYTEGEAEYVWLEGGRTVRLDQIVEIENADRN